MPRLMHKLPSYSRHKSSGQAVVSIQGRDVYLGKYGSPESKQKYNDLIAKLVAHREVEPQRPLSVTPTTDDLRISELLVVFLDFADGYYRKNGKSTNEAENFKAAAKPLAKLYKDARVTDFGPLDLKRVREAMINDKLSRGVINSRVNRIRRMFKWGVENELVGPSVLHALQAVAPLKRGRTAARECSPVKPVAVADIETVKALVPAPFRAMIDLQLFTGMRPGEVVIMRPADIDRSKPIWIYRPTSHKTEHHEIERQIYLGPKAQDVLRAFLLRPEDAYLFSPRDVLIARAKKLREELNRKQWRKGGKRIRVRSDVADHYSRNTYHNRIYRACRTSGITPWGPNRLRHNAATYLREEFGIEAARVILGHTSAAMTEVYAEIDRTKAFEIMMQVG